MNVFMNHEQLLRTIGRLADVARESRQVADRLRQLLPQQLLNRKRLHAKRGRMGEAERLALVDADYIEHIEQLVAIRQDAWRARIEYETHLMLAHARQSLNAARRREHHHSR